MSWLTMEVLREQYRDLPILMTPEKCKNATFIVTGANIGLGLETARHLVRLGSTKVIMAVRNTEAGEEAARDIEASTNTKGVAVVWHLDLGNYESVKAFAKRAIEDLERLDGLVENASIALDKWSTSENHETTTTVNVYSTVLLGVLLFPKLKETGRKFNVSPHLVVVSSGLAFSYESQVEGLRQGGLKSLDDKKSTNMATRYAVTKMVQILAILQFAKLYPVSETGVIVNLLNPGLVKTGLTRRLGLVSRLLIGFFRFLIARTAEMGSRTILHAMNAGKESHGSYVSDCKIMNVTVPSWLTDADGKKLQEKVWKEITEELEKVEPGCVAKIS